MPALAFTAGCGHCGAPLALVNQTHRPSEVVGILECSSCRRGWSVQLRMFAERNRESERRAKHRAAA